MKRKMVALDLKAMASAFDANPQAFKDGVLATAGSNRNSRRQLARMKKSPVKVKRK